MTATSNHVQPQTGHLIDETTDPVTVARDGVKIQPTLNNASQPSSRFAKRQGGGAYQPVEKRLVFVAFKRPL